MNAKRTQQAYTSLYCHYGDVVVFPYMVMPLFCWARKIDWVPLVEAMNEGKQLFIGVTKAKRHLEEPTVDDVFDVGTIANIIQLLKLPDGW